MAVSRFDNRPNYFVALQLTNKETIENLKEAQKCFASRFKRYADYEMSPNSFHLTLALLKLETRDDKQACVEAMKRRKSKIESLARETEPLTFQGLGHFNTEVVYAEVTYCQKFLKLVHEIRDILKEAGYFVEKSPFRPHLTLFNTRKPVGWGNEEISLNNEDGSRQKFGSQCVDNIQLCEMGTLGKGEGSFYKNIFKINID